MEEMNELFYRQPYTREFDAQVVSCTAVEDAYEIVLSDTAFYPEGGGQPADTGTLGEIDVYDVRRKDGVIVHLTHQPLKEGAMVHGVLDWQRRFDHMQSHSGEHLVSGLIHRKYGYDNVGFHMGEMIQIDLDGPLTMAQAREIENAANEVIWKNEPIEVSYPDKDALAQMTYRSKKDLSGRVRIVTIPDGDVCACCGTHTAMTGEIGLIRILTCEKHKNGVRIQMLAGRKALLYDQAVFDQDHIISGMLSAKMLETSEAVKGLQKQILDQKYQIGALTKEILHHQVEQFKNDLAVAVAFEEGIDREAMIEMANTLVDQKNARVAGIFSRNGDKYGYVILSHTVNLKDCSRLLNESLHGQGGGTSDILQGNFASCEEDIQSVMEQLFGSQGK